MNVIRGRNRGEWTLRQLHGLSDGASKPILFFPRKLKSNRKWKAPKLSQPGQHLMGNVISLPLPSTPWRVHTTWYSTDRCRVFCPPESFPLSSGQLIHLPRNVASQCARLPPPHQQAERSEPAPQLLVPLSS